MKPAMPRRIEKPEDGRKARRKDPPYMMWRGGRPAWIPGPALRRAGWETVNLKSPYGNWLGRAEARDMARRVNEDVARWRAGEAPLGFAPQGEAAAIHSPAATQRNIEAAWGLFSTSRQYRALAPATQAGYRKDMSRFIARFGNEAPHIIDRAVFSAWWEAEFDRLFATKAMDWSDDDWTAAPRARDPHGAAYVAEVRRARDIALHEAKRIGANIPGQAQMNAIQRAVSRLYRHILDELRWPDVTVNPAAGFGARGLKPRLVLPSDQDLAVLVETADAMGRPSIGDALVFLANIGQRPADMIAHTLTGLEEGRIASLIRKTGATTDFKFPRLFFKRLAVMRTRRAEAGGNWPDLFLATDEQRIAYKSDHLRHCFEAVRAAAAKKRPGIADLHMYDFRKLAITRHHLARNSRDDIAAVTGHSYKTVADILDHYIVPTREAADAAIDRLDKYQAEKGVKW